MAKLALFLVVVCFQFFMAEELLASDDAPFNDQTAPPFLDDDYEIILDDQTLAQLDKELEAEFQAWEQKKSLSKQLATAQVSDYDEYSEEDLVPSVSSAKGSGKYASESIMRRGRSAEGWPEIHYLYKRFTSV